MLLNSIMNVSFGQITHKKKNFKSFSKGPFLGHFLYFSVLLQVIHRLECQISILLHSV